jgi:hypothetical protein
VNYSSTPIAGTPRLGDVWACCAAGSEFVFQLFRDEARQAQASKLGTSSSIGLDASHLLLVYTVNSQWASHMEINKVLPIILAHMEGSSSLAHSACHPR